MAWARIDDGFHDHPKVDDLSLAAVGLWTLCLTWTHRHRRTALIPGHITEARVRKVAGKSGNKLVTELVNAGLWDPEDGIGGWVIHDFADYLPRERDPDERRESGRKGAAKRWLSDSKLPSSSHVLDSKPIVSDSSRASAPAFPSRPVPSEELKDLVEPLPESKPTDLKSQKDPRFVEFWSVYPRRVAPESALKALAKVLKAGAPLEDVVKGAGRYRDDPTRKPEFTAHAATWLNAGRWNDESTVTPNGAPRRSAGWEFGMD